MGRDVSGKTREIDGLTYEVFLLPPKQALKVLTRLSKVLGEPLGVAAGSFLGAGGAEKPVGLADREIDSDVFGKALAALADRLDEGMVLETVETLVANVHVQGDGDAGTRPVRFDSDFGGKVLLLLKVVGFALEVNFSDFFGAAGASGVVARARAAATGLTLAKPTSTGGTGGPS